MKNLILSFLLIFSLINVIAQSAEELYEQGLQAVEEDKYEEAIILFSKSIGIEPSDPYTWYNRGVAKSMLRLYEEALPDFEQAIIIAPKYKNAYLLRGMTKKDLTDYRGAIADYTHALQLDSTFSYAYYHRARTHEMLSNHDSACNDYRSSLILGMKEAEKKVEQCNDTTLTGEKIYPILRLTQISSDKNYGFEPDRPIKVGKGPDGGPANNRAYLNLLRDPLGNPVKYYRKGSCCPYPSENGLFGSALVDHYEITYFDPNGKTKKASVYISFYDYEEPKILYGFKTVKQY